MKAAANRRVRRPAIAITLPLALAAGQASAIDLGIENDAEYAMLVSAMRAAEYVRSDVIVSETPKQRVYAVLAGVMAYAERNPHASETQISTFLSAFDTSCRGYAAGDPDLNERANLYAAIRFATVDDAALDGTDTRIGLRALELIGIAIPNPDGYVTNRSRMVEFEIAMGRPLDYRNEIFDLLVTGFFGQDPAGAERPGLPAILDAYFESEGFDPELGGTRADLPQIDAGLALLPVDYAAYELAISAGAQNTALRSIVTDQLNSVRDRITAIVGVDESIDDGSLDSALANDTGLVDSLNRSRNDQAYVNGALAELRAKLEATAQARAAASSATFLMLQSDDGTIEAYASFTRDYSQITLETNEQMAQVETGVKLASTVGLALVGGYLGNPEIIVGSFASLGSQVLDIALAQDAAPSVEEQTFDQIIELRLQVEQMRQEMNVRFDRIDRQLNTMYTQIGVGFAAIGEDIGDLTADVGVLVFDMAVARSELRGLEASLYGVANSVLLQDLTFETDLALDFRADELGDFPYRDLDTNFVTASTIFYNYATSGATDPVFAGPLPDGVTIDNVYDTVAAGYSTTQFINDLAALPQAFGLGALAPTALVGIEPWSQAAAAYAQLARENPWYFGYRNGGGGTTELAEIIQSGDRVVEFIEAVRETEADGSSPLFEALVQNYKGAASEFQSAVDASIVEFLPGEFKNGADKLNLWAGSPQRDLWKVTGRIESLVDADGGAAQPLDLPFFGLPYRGWEMFTDANSPDQVALLQTAYLLDKAKTGPFIEVRPVFESIFLLGSSTVGKYRLSASIENARVTEFGNARISRSFYYYAEFKFVDPFSGDITWVPITGYSKSEIEDMVLDIWNNTDLKNVFTSSINSTPGPSQVFTSGNQRMRIYQGGGTDPISQNEVLPELRSYRIGARQDLSDKILFDPTSVLYDAADGLDQAAALLNAYVSIGMSGELNESQVLRSALRAAPGVSELGLGSADVISLIAEMDQTDSNSRAWADQSFNVTRIGDILNARIDVVAGEIERGLGADRPAVAPAYVTWVLSELKHLQETATELAIDDTYVVPSSRVLSTTFDDGLLANDLDQPELVISVDLGYTSDPGYIAPANGTVELNADGTFTYRADPGFVGTDSFTYRSTAMIPDTISPVLSEPARVVVIVDNASCSTADANGDGILDLGDINTFVTLFLAGDTTADTNGDGILDLGDIQSFVAAFLAGC